MQIDPYTGKQIQSIRTLPRDNVPLLERREEAGDGFKALLIAAALAVLLLLISGYAHAGGQPIGGTTNVYSGGGNAVAGAAAGATAGATGGAVGGVSAGGASVDTKTFGFGMPSFSNASQCPIGQIPVIGGTTGAEFCRALWTALITGDRGPVCKSQVFSQDMDEFCEAYWAKHGKP